MMFISFFAIGLIPGLFIIDFGEIINLLYSINKKIR